MRKKWLQFESRSNFQKESRVVIRGLGNSLIDRNGSGIAMQDISGIGRIVKLRDKDDEYSGDYYPGGGATRVS